MTDQHHPIILILGPTAGGKTELSLRLAEQLPGGGEVIGADSMQVYRGMNIGTAKPTPEERARAPHHLIDIAEPNEPYTVDDWATAAKRVIQEIRDRGRWPIVVGGTNLYIKVLLEGIFDGPPPDNALRATLAEQPTTTLHERLKTIDPEAAKRIHVNDRKRLTRAIEVFEQTGRPISEWQQQWDQADRGMRKDSILIGLDWPPETINQRINARVKQMIEEGLPEEVRRLWEANRLGLQAREALGYKQLLPFLEGSGTLEDAIEATKIETRRFARKQRTWLKRFRAHPRSLWIPAPDMDTQAIATQALTFCIDHADPT